MKYLPHQIAKADQALVILKDKYYVYIYGKPRSGKTATALRVAELTKINSWLILCPKQAIPGWGIFLKDKELGLEKKYKIINYEQVYIRSKTPKGRTVYKLRYEPSNYAGVIIDESHNLGSMGKPSARIQMIRKMCMNMVHIHLSGTPVIEAPGTIFHQMWVSKYSPFNFISFYKFFEKYGKPYTIKLMGRDVNQYDRYKDILLKEIESFTVYMDQKDAGIEIEAVDKVHYIKLDKKTEDLYRDLNDDLVIENFNNLGVDLVADSVMKLRTSLHMIEGGTIKIEDEYYSLGNKEKIDYVKNTFGDSPDVGIMCHFVHERALLKEEFKHAEIYSSTSHAEGVDLSHLKHFIIYSSGYSGAKFVQRRERIINMKGSNTTTVHHLICKGKISEMVYKSCSKKQDFNNLVFKGFST